jgi:hypothetical protein
MHRGAVVLFFSLFSMHENHVTQSTSSTEMDVVDCCVVRVQWSVCVYLLFTFGTVGMWVVLYQGRLAWCFCPEAFQPWTALLTADCCCCAPFVSNFAICLSFLVVHSGIIPVFPLVFALCSWCSC